MARAAARRDARFDWDAGPLHTNAGQGVEVGDMGGFQLGFSARLQRQAPQPVGDEHHDFGIIFHMEFAGQFVHVFAHGTPWQEHFG